MPGRASNVRAAEAAGPVPTPPTILRHSQWSVCAQCCQNGSSSRPETVASLGGPMRLFCFVMLAGGAVAAAAASAQARPFIDPRTEVSDAIDQAAANEPRDPACRDRRL